MQWKREILAEPSAAKPLPVVHILRKVPLHGEDLLRAGDVRLAALGERERLPAAVEQAAPNALFHPAH